MSGRMENDIENTIAQLFRDIGRALKNLIRCVGYGMKELRRERKLPLLILVSFAGTGAALLFRREILEGLAADGSAIPWILAAPRLLRIPAFFLLLFMPLWAMAIIGSGVLRKQQKYRATFESIGLKTKNGRCPAYIDTVSDGKKEILIFSSELGLSAWKSVKEALEVGFDRNILRFEYGKKKSIVKITTVPNTCVIPQMLPWSDRYISGKNGEIVVGRGALEYVSFNLNRTPHVLIAGETGSGKSVILRCCLWQMVNQGARIYMLDFKGGVEFGKEYEQYGEVVVTRDRALEVLDALVRENEYRLSVFRDLQVKNLPEYNRKTGQNLCRIGLFCDEIAEMLDKKGVGKKDREVFEQLEGRLSTLARLSRATGINLFLGVQRPDANVLTGQIKNNVPVRISGRFADKAASEIVLGNTDAVELPDIKGRFLYRSGNEIVEFQSFFFEDDKALREVHVEVGDMLTETPGYVADLADRPEAEKQYTAAKPDPGKTSGSGRKRKTAGGAARESMSEKESAAAEELLRQMDEFDSICPF